MKNLDEASVQLNKTLADVRELVQVIGRSEGTFQKFIAEHEPDIVCLQETKAEKGQAEIDLPDYQESALEAVDVTGTPRTLTQVYERVHRAVFDPDSVGDEKHLQGWQSFV